MNLSRRMFLHTGLMTGAALAVSRKCLPNQSFPAGMWATPTPRPKASRPGP
jgi:hypothetical protein